MSSHWLIRPAKGADLNLIYSTWTNSFQIDSQLGRSVRKSTYKKYYYPVVDYILDHAKVTVACLKEDEEIVLGYLVHEPGIAHYAWVKEAFHKHGIMRSLVESVFTQDEYITITHKTGWIKSILRKFPQFEYNPFLLMKKVEESYG